MEYITDLPLEIGLIILKFCDIYTLKILQKIPQLDRYHDEIKKMIKAINIEDMNYHTSILKQYITGLMVSEIKYKYKGQLEMRRLYSEYSDSVIAANKKCADEIKMLIDSSKNIDSLLVGYEKIAERARNSVLENWKIDVLRPRQKILKRQLSYLISISVNCDINL